MPQSVTFQVAKKLKPEDIHSGWVQNFTLTYWFALEVKFGPFTENITTRWTIVGTLVGLSESGTGRGLLGTVGFVTTTGSEDPSKSFRLKALRTTGRMKRHKDRSSWGSRVTVQSLRCWFDISNAGTVSPPFFQSDGIVSFQSNI